MSDSDAEKVPPEVTRYEALAALLHMAIALGILVGVIGLLSFRFRAPLEEHGRAFVEHFGALGVAGGAFLADGVHFPVPPQFYLLAGEAGGMARATALSSALVGSMTGGLAAFALARRASSWRLLSARARMPKRVVAVLFQRHGYVGIVMVGTLPISFWVLCTALGVLRLPWRAYGVLALMRVPRLLLSYAVIVMAWGAS